MASDHPREQLRWDLGYNENKYYFRWPRAAGTAKKRKFSTMALTLFECYFSFSCVYAIIIPNMLTESALIKIGAPHGEIKRKLSQ